MMFCVIVVYKHTMHTVLSSKLGILVLKNLDPWSIQEQ